MIDEISTFIKNHWSQWLINAPSPKHLRYLKTASSLTSRSNMNLFVFRDDNPRPSLLLRIPRDSESTKRLIEQDIKFHSIKSLLNKSSISFLPDELGIYEMDNIHFSVSLVKDLPPMSSTPKYNEQITKDFKGSLEWLLAFHEETTSHFAPMSIEIINRTILKVIEDGQRYGQFSSSETSFLQRIVEKARQSIGLVAPIGWIHGDFWPRNILVGHGSFTVVDWEHSEGDALPFLDMFIFCLGYGLCLEPQGNNRVIKGFQNTFFKPGIVSNMSEMFLKEYLQRREINPILCEIYFPISILELEIRQKDSEELIGNHVSPFERFSYLVNHYDEKSINFSFSS